MPSEFTYGTFANYSPRGTSEPSRRSRAITAAIKAGRVSQVERMIPRLAEPAAAILTPFLNPNVTLVPVPRSAPIKEDALWPSKVIADILCAAGYGARVETLITRISPVQKSAFAAARERPLVHTHIESLRVRFDLLQPEQITLVDDVLTKGATTAACAELLHEEYPNATIRIFAVMRTLGFVDEIETVFDPCVGRIVSHASGNPYREP
ncbi:MAG: hypothetical protein RLQ73_18125 [Hoeflea sp. D1-CHI-28]